MEGPQNCRNELLVKILFQEVHFSLINTTVFKENEAKSDFIFFEHRDELGCDVCLYRTVDCGLVEDGTKLLWDNAHNTPIFCGCKDFSCKVYGPSLDQILCL